jgi:hypothetical protein
MSLTMTLTPEDRKKLLGHGGLARIARRLKCTPGHLSEVNRAGRPDQKARAAIAREILAKHPHISESEIWPQSA